MSLFEFLMILLSIIVGLGIAEILGGLGRILRAGRIAEMGWIHSSLAVLILLALLQVFWESWSLQSIETWTFPAMVMMLTSPVCLHLIANLMFPGETVGTTLEAHYFQQHRLIWSLAIVAIIVGSSYRSIAFGNALFVVDNLSAIPQFVMALLLLVSAKPVLHKVLLPLGALAIALDTLFITYFIR